MHLVNVATSLWDVRFVRLAIVDGAQRRGYSVRSKSAVTDRPLQFRRTTNYAGFNCGSQPQRLQRAGQALFNLVDQLWNIDRLG